MENEFFRAPGTPVLGLGTKSNVSVLVPVITPSTQVHNLTTNPMGPLQKTWPIILGPFKMAIGWTLEVPMTLSRTLKYAFEPTIISISHKLT